MENKKKTDLFKYIVIILLIIIICIGLLIYFSNSEAIKNFKENLMKSLDSSESDLENGSGNPGSGSDSGTGSGSSDQSAGTGTGSDAGTGTGTSGSDSTSGGTSNGSVPGSDSGTSDSDTQQSEPNKLRIFVTDREWLPYNLGGVSGADDKCQDAADKATLGGTWIALLSSDAQDAKDLVSPGIPIVRLDSVQVADDKVDMFDGTIDNEIRVNELLNFEKGWVWTGTYANGSATDIDCQDWTIVLKYGTVGKVGGSYTDLRWIYDSEMDCEMGSHLYCIEVFG